MERAFFGHEPHDKPGGIVRSLGGLYQGKDGSPKDGWWTPSKPAAACTAIVLSAVLLPDLNALFRDPTVGWLVYLGLSQVSMALLCLLPWMAGVTGKVRIISTAAAPWFIGQAIDEFTNGNLFKDGYWEYGWLAACIAATWIMVYLDKVRALWLIVLDKIRPLWLIVSDKVGPLWRIVSDKARALWRTIKIAYHDTTAK